MNPQVPGQALQLRRQRQQLLPGRSSKISAKGARQTLRMRHTARIVHVERTCQAFHGCRREAQHAGHIAHGGTRAEGHQRAGHRGVVLPIAAIGVLDHFLAVVGSQVEINIRQRLALAGEEALEDQGVGYRVNGRDAQQIGDERVGGAATSLAADALLSRVAHQVPDDEEVVGQVQVGNHAEFLLQQRARGLVGIASRERRLTQFMERVESVRGIEDGEGLVSGGQEGGGGGASRGDRESIGKRHRRGGKGILDFRQRPPAELIVGPEGVPGSLERGVAANAGEHIVEPLFFRVQVMHVARGDYGQFQILPQADQIAQQAHLAGQIVALQFQVAVPGEPACQTFSNGARGAVTPFSQQAGNQSFSATTEDHQPGGVLRQYRPG